MLSTFYTYDLRALFWMRHQTKEGSGNAWRIYIKMLKYSYNKMIDVLMTQGEFFFLFLTRHVVCTCIKSPSLWISVEICGLFILLLKTTLKWFKIDAHAVSNERLGWQNLLYRSTRIINSSYKLGVLKFYKP